MVRRQIVEVSVLVCLVPLSRWLICCSAVGGRLPVTFVQPDEGDLGSRSVGRWLVEVGLLYCISFASFFLHPHLSEATESVDLAARSIRRETLSCISATACELSLVEAYLLHLDTNAVARLLQISSHFAVARLRTRELLI
jgi:hypothetical protein